VDNRLGSGANTTTYTYDPANNLATVTYPNGLQSTLSYDQLNRLASLTSSVSGYDYQYGPTGNRTSSAEANGCASPKFHPGAKRPWFGCPKQAWRAFSTGDGGNLMPRKVANAVPVGSHGISRYTSPVVALQLSAVMLEAVAQAARS